MTLDKCDPCTCIPGYLGTSEWYQKVLEVQCQILGAIGGSGEFVPGVDCSVDLGNSTHRFKDIYLCGNVILSAASAEIIPGATSLLFRNHANSANNLTITDAGLVSVVRSDLGITAGNLTFGAASASIIPGATSLLFRNNANNASNLTITDAGLVSVVRGNLAVTAGNLTFGAASASIIPGATSLLFRDNGNANTNLTILDSGAITMSNRTGANFQVPKQSILGTVTSTFSGIDAVFAAPRVYVPADITSNANLAFAVKGASTAGVFLEFFKTRATADYEPSTIVNSGDRLGSLFFYGANGTSYSLAAEMRVTVDATPGATNDMPGAFDFLVSPDGSATVASALKLTNDKLATFGGSLLSSVTTAGIIQGIAAIPSNVSSVTNTGLGLLIAKNSSSNSDQLGLIAFGANAVQVNIDAFKTRANDGNAGTIVNSGDGILAVTGFGADGTVYRRAASIVMTVDGTPGSGSMPGAIDLQVTPSGSSTLVSAFKISNNAKQTIPATNTAGGTTGAQTINKPSGTVNFAAAASTLVVTNSLVTTSSIVFAVIRTNDTTATIKNVVPTNGSFTITLTAAATAETSVGFYCLN